MSDIIVSGFKKWGEHDHNSSEQAVTQAQFDDHLNIKKLILPVSWSDAWPYLKEHINPSTHHVLAFGMSPAKEVLIEKIAINLCNQQPDCDGKITDRYAIEGAPPGYWSTLPIQNIIDNIKKENIPVTRSPHAGTYLCNFIFYQLCHYAQQHNISLNVGFIHLPKVGEEGLPLEQLKHAVKIATMTCLETS